MPRPIVDYGHRPPRAPARRAPRRPSRRALAVTAAGLILLILGGLTATAGRQLYHRLRAHGTSASHAMSGQQLAALTSVTPEPYDPPDFRRAPAATDPSPTPLPASALLEVPYTVQAPFNNWKVHEESCEEAALLMYHDFLEGDRRADLPPGEVDPELRAMKAWQVTNWGAERDLTVDRIGQLAEQYYGYGYQAGDATRDNIEAALAAGHPVIVPVMTHALDNPNYGPRTVYHVVLIKGYTAAGVVTNDGGIMQGKNWFYSWSVLFSAIDAQTPKMDQGRRMLVVFRK